MQRIVTLNPGATELVCALGLEDALVGCSHLCDYPPSVAGVPSCTAPASSLEHEREGDLRVLAAAHRLVNWDQVAALAPEWVVTCSESTGYDDGLAGIPEELRDRVLLLPPVTTMADVWRCAHHLAETLHREKAGAELVGGLQSRMAAIVNQAIGLVARPRTVVLEWVDPARVSGGYMPELIEMAGGKYLLQRSGNEGMEVSLDMLVAEAPEVILISGRNMTIQRAREEVQTLTNAAEWWALPAVRQEQVFVADGVHYFHRPGPRLVESLEIVAEILHPDEFQFGHGELAWQVL